MSKVELKLVFYFFIPLSASAGQITTPGTACVQNGSSGMGAVQQDIGMFGNKSSTEWIQVYCPFDVSFQAPTSVFATVELIQPEGVVAGQQAGCMIYVYHAGDSYLQKTASQGAKPVSGVVTVTTPVAQILANNLSSSAVAVRCNLPPAINGNRFLIRRITLNW